MEATGRVFRSLARLEPLPMTPPEAVLRLFLIRRTAGGRTPCIWGLLRQEETRTLPRALQVGVPG